MWYFLLCRFYCYDLFSKGVDQFILCTAIHFLIQSKYKEIIIWQRLRVECAVCCFVHFCNASGSTLVTNQNHASMRIEKIEMGTDSGKNMPISFSEKQ